MAFIITMLAIIFGQEYLGMSWFLDHYGATLFLVALSAFDTVIGWWKT